MRKLFLIFLLLSISNFAQAKTIELTRCYIKEDKREFEKIKKPLWNYVNESMTPTEGFNDEIFKYSNQYINTKTLEVHTKFLFTDKFAKKAKKEHDEWLGIDKITDLKKKKEALKIFKPGMITNKRKFTRYDKKNNLLILEKKFNEGFYYTKKEKYEKELNFKGFRWNDIQMREIINLNTGLVEQTIVELGGIRFLSIKCDSPLNDGSKQFKPNELIVMGSGSGFYISGKGHIVTNFHVIGNCKFVSTEFKGKEFKLDILKTDKANDLAILKGKFNNRNFLKIKKEGADLGEDIVAFGYPLGSSLSDSVKITKGVVSSLSGIDNDSSMIQIDAAIQPGNSGGPVLNMYGSVVGVASSGLDASKFFKNKGYIPQNVNFAISTNTLSNFLRTSGIHFESASLMDYETYSTKKIASIGQPNTMRLYCINTASAYSKMKTDENFTNVLKDGGTVRRYKKVKN